MSEKFGNNPAAEHLYEVSLDGGTDANIGSVQFGAWHGMIRHLWVEDLEKMGLGEASEVSCAILHEDSNGFVWADLFTSDADMDAAWKVLADEEERCVLLSHFDSLGLVSPAAWDMPFDQVLHQVREANAFSDEEWDALVEAAWNNAY